MGANPFGMCSRLRGVEIRGNPNFIFKDNFLIDVSGGKNSGTIVSYLGDPAAASVEIPETVTSIGEGAFEGCRRRLVLRTRGSIRLERYAFGTVQLRQEHANWGSWGLLLKESWIHWTGLYIALQRRSTKATCMLPIPTGCLAGAQSARAFFPFISACKSEVLFVFAL